MGSETSEVHKALENLEDYSLDNHLSRSYNYNAILGVLEKNVQISVEEAQRLLSVCIHDLNEDKQHAAAALDVIYMIVTQIEDRNLEPQLDLTPSILSVLHITKILSVGNLENIKSLCFRTLLSYPDNALLAASENVADILQIIDLNINITDVNKTQPLHILNRILKLLPHEQKKLFITSGLDIWLSKLIPITMVHYQKASSEFENILESLEIITNYIVEVDFSENKHWRSVLSSICNSQGYSYIMRKCLSNGCNLWQRIWVVFIKLLKNQSTQLIPNIGTPINSMLPVVETAFKLDVTNRCRAFQCWTELIDSFCKETNEKNIIKRIKLLIIPLKSNNAKIEETVLAKLKCWWHLIQKFEDKMDKFLDLILVSLLNFCFGKPDLDDKHVFIPGQISFKTQIVCMEAIVDIVGHYNCNGCTSLPKLSTKLLNTKHLIDNWSHWIFALSSTIMLSINSDHGLNDTQLKCLWKSFFLTIGELNENNIRNDLVGETINVIFEMVKLKSNVSPMKLASTVITVLIVPLFEGDIRIIQLLRSKNNESDPLYRILKIVMNPTLDVMYQKYDTTELIKKLKFLTNFVTNKMYSSPNCVTGWLMNNLPERNCGLLLWTCLAESVIETQCDLKTPVVIKMLTWPLKACTKMKTAVFFDYVKVLAITWYQLFGLVVAKLPPTDKDELDKHIFEFLFTLRLDKQSQVTLYFKLCILSAVLKYKLTKSNSLSCDTDMELFKNLVSNIYSYTNFELLFPILIDKVSAVLSGIKPEIAYKSIANNVFVSIKYLLQVLAVECSKSDQDSLVWTLAKSLLKSIETAVSDTFYTEILQEIYVDLKNHSAVYMLNPITKGLLINIKEEFSLHDGIKDFAQSYKSPVKTDSPKLVNVEENSKKSINKFPLPGSKSVPKKLKKKETSIVKTVVENGEEYVVVKSNWKFNPRKLTENQKEKFQRKSEIPALYQDLSQSQDEFKLSTWKTDSQDTTSTSSKSETVSSKTNNNEPATEILKKMASTNIVPQIIDNFFSENGSKTTNIAKDLGNKDSVLNSETPSPKNTKSPRMALKDRVFKNVRNLIEKSGVQKENKDLTEDCNKTLNIPKTPTATKSNNLDSVVNSAPPMLSADRPSRVKRKPKKFDDSDLLALKKSRRLSIDAISAKVGGKTTTKSLLQNDHELSNNLDNAKVDKTQNSDTNSGEENVTNVLPVIEKNVTRVGKSIPEEIINIVAIQEVNVNESECKEIPVKDKTPEPIIDNKLSTECNSISTSTDVGKSDSEVVNEVAKEVNIEICDKNKESETAKSNTNNDTNKEISTPKSDKVNEESKSTPKKTRGRKSRIEKELAIDTVEGHPFLKIQSEKRLTRKALETNTTRRKSLAEKKLKSDVLCDTPKPDKKSREKNKSTSITVVESQEQNSSKNDSYEELPFSDDIIESSQDSTATTVSVRSTKKVNKMPVVALEKIPLNLDNIVNSQSILDNIATKQPNKEDNRDDTILPLNKTATGDATVIEDLTENMDTEPMDGKEMSDVILVDDGPEPITVSDETPVGPETQEIAEADTLPTDPKIFMDVDDDKISDSCVIVEPIDKQQPTTTQEAVSNSQSCSEKSISPTDATITLSESACAEIENAQGVSSPLKDKVERKQDFLNNTLEISPIKTMSPDRTKKSPSPETSSDYVVIQLSSPVHINGEPFDKCGSPEVFTEEKTSPDKQNYSPPRAEVIVTNTSPSSSLSLKKNRPQVRSGGRGAQMLGLCVPDKVQAIVNPERNESDEVKRSNTVTPARRNLRVLYASVADNTETVSASEESSHFLRLGRSLPAVDSSPAGPILKRKYAEITEDLLVSPASKRKRVSFHDPPVSTTVSVQKYIEPGVRSPQNSTQKRLERQMRQQPLSKSPKRLSNVFKLDTVLTKTVESFTDANGKNDETITSIQSASLDETPVVEIVRACELNDIDPICPELVNCTDDIEKIAGDLASPSMKESFLTALQGKIATIGDLARMTELEISRSCIKAPKVETAKEVLTYYAANRVENSVEVTIIDEAAFDEPFVSSMNIEVQTDRQECCEMEVQTVPTLTVMNSSQTEITPCVNSVVQTDETGSKSTEDIIKTCLTERTDFVDQLQLHLEESSKQLIADKLPLTTLTDLLINRIDSSNSKPILSRILDQQSSKHENQRKNEMGYIREFLCERFDSKDLVLLCSDVLKSVYDRPAKL